MSLRKTMMMLSILVTKSLLAVQAKNRRQTGMMTIRRMFHLLSSRVVRQHIYKKDGILKLAEESVQ